MNRSSSRDQITGLGPVQVVLPGKAAVALPLQDAQAPAGEDGAVVSLGDAVPVGNLSGGERNRLAEGVLFQNDVIHNLGHVIAAQGLVHVTVPALPQVPPGLLQRSAFENREAGVHFPVLPLLGGGVLLRQEGPCQHGAELGGGDLPDRLEGAVAVAVHHPGVQGPLDFRSGPVVRREVVKARRLSREEQAEQGQQRQEDFFHKRGTPFS